MADVKIRRLESWVVESLRIRAEAAGRSLEEELRRVLADAALKPQYEAYHESAAFCREMEEKYGVLPDSTPLIRADRDERG